MRVAYSDNQSRMSKLILQQIQAKSSNQNQNRKPYSIEPFLCVSGFLIWHLLSLDGLFNIWAPHKKIAGSGLNCFDVILCYVHSALLCDTGGPSIEMPTFWLSVTYDTLLTSNVLVSEVIM